MYGVSVSCLLVILVQHLCNCSVLLDCETDDDVPLIEEMYETHPFLRRRNLYNKNADFFNWNNNPRKELESPRSVTSNKKSYRDFPSRFDTYLYGKQNIYNDNLNNNIECSIPFTVSPLIYQGNVFNQGKYPWLAALFNVQDSGLKFMCGGTLISKKHVLTGGHCIMDNNNIAEAKNLAVVLGLSNIENLSPAQNNIFGVEDVHLHPDYKHLSSDGDVAVLRLEDTAFFDTPIRPACLWSGSTDLDEIIGIVGTVAGWGRTEDGTLSLTEPREIKIPVVSQETCLQSNVLYRSITSDRTFCAGFRNGAGPCNGDSGNGFIIEKHGRWMLRGLVSIGVHKAGSINSCDLDFYVVFTDISKFSYWIYSVIN